MVRKKGKLTRQKLDLEKQKLDFEKERLKSHGDQVKIKKAKPNFLAIVFAFVAGVTIFLPWVRGWGNSFLQAFGQEYSGEFSTGPVLGVYTPEGMLVLFLLAIGILFNIKGNRLAFIFGVASLALIVLFNFRVAYTWATVKGNSPFPTDDVEFILAIQDGWIISLVATIAYSFFAILKLQNRNLYFRK